MDGREIVSAIRARLADRLGKDRYEVWFSPTTELSLRDQTLQVTVASGESAQLDFKMDERAVTLDELVVTGYSVTARRERTGAQAQLKRDKIEVMPITTADQAIQGKTAGVQVRTNTGQPGGAVGTDVTQLLRHATAPGRGSSAR